MSRLLLLGLALSLTACMTTTTQTKRTLVSRASYDLQCAKEDVIVTPIGGTTYEVQCCGLTRLYTCSVYGTTCVPEGAALPPGAEPSAVR